MSAEVTGPAHVVVVASAGRPELLGATVASLESQTVRADLVVVSIPSPQDAPPDIASRDRVRVVIAPRGLTAQRNAGVRAAGGTPGLVTFIDDDAVLADDYFERLHAFMAAQPDVVLVTGLVLADGILGGEITRARALEILADAPLQESVRPSFAYGCNMTARGWAALAEPFDERLRLYGWQEDYDFSARLWPLGRCVVYEGCRAVHLATGSGRVNGKALGFAQVVNPFYLWRKGSKPGRNLLEDWTRYLAANTYKALHADRPDRRGRLVGNLLGLREVVLHGGRPEAIERLVTHRPAQTAPQSTR